MPPFHARDQDHIGAAREVHAIVCSSDSDKDGSSHSCPVEVVCGAVLLVCASLTALDIGQVGFWYFVNEF